MDLSAKLPHNDLVEMQGYAFFVDIEYENLSHFCSHCKMIGHSLQTCKNLKANTIEKA